MTAIAINLTDNDKPLPPPAASALLDSMGFPVAEGTLAQKRVHGGGPQFVKFGRRVLYKPSALRQWVDAQTRELASTSEAKAA
jgi:hypothetical protein